MIAFIEYKLCHEIHYNDMGSHNMYLIIIISVLKYLRFLQYLLIKIVKYELSLGTRCSIQTSYLNVGGLRLEPDGGHGVVGAVHVVGLPVEAVAHPLTLAHLREMCYIIDNWVV